MKINVTIKALVFSIINKREYSIIYLITYRDRPYRMKTQKPVVAAQTQEAKQEIANAVQSKVLTRL